ncbi:MAG: ATP-binding protein [Chloroflexi bacterium]|nr:ATP-binding protein [Chloroflexota bacterium]
MVATTKPLLLVINGAPATGKSTLATLLAREFGLPHLSKDLIKEALFDTIGAPTRERSRELSGASYRVLYIVAHQILAAGLGVILESNFARGISEPEITALFPLARPAVLYCETRRDVIIQRQERRAMTAERHPGHHDALVLPGLLAGLDAGIYQPLDLPAPLLRIETSDGYHPELNRIVAFIRTAAATTPTAALPASLHSKH